MTKINNDLVESLLHKDENQVLMRKFKHCLTMVIGHRK